MKKLESILLTFLLSWVYSYSQVSIDYLNGYIWLNHKNNYFMKLESANNTFDSLYILSSDGQKIFPDSLGHFQYHRIDTSKYSCSFTIFNFNNKRVGKRDFNFLPFPSPTAQLNWKHLTWIHEGEINENQLLNSMLKANVLNYDFSISVKIANFSIMIIRNDKLICNLICIGNAFNEKERKLLQKRLKPYDKVVFYNIQTEGSEHSCNYLNTISLILRK